MTKRKPKFRFRVGQVVWCEACARYAKVLSRKFDADTGKFLYAIDENDLVDWKEGEMGHLTHDLRPLTAREKGEAHR